MSALTSVGYASGNFGKAVLTGTLEITLLFLLTDIFLYSPLFAGGLFFATLIWGAALDLIWGWVIDRFDVAGSKYGTYMLLGTPVVIVSFTLLYALPLLNISNIATVCALLFFIKIGITLLDLPHNALLPEIEKNSRARNNLALLRFAFSSVAFVAISLSLVYVMGAESVQQLRRTFMVIGLTGSMLGTASVLFSWWVVRDYERHNVTTRSGHLSWSAFRALWHPDYVILFVTIAMSPFATLLFAKTLLHYTSHVLGDGELASTILGFLVLGQLMGILFWYFQSRYLEKSTVLALSYSIMAIGYAVFFGIGAGSPQHIVATAALIGFGMGGALSLIWSMAADCVDRTRQATGISLGTLGFGFLSFGSKASSGLSALLFGSIMTFADYRPDGSNPDSTLYWIRVCNSLIPAIAATACVIVLLRYSLTHSRHKEVEH